MSAFEFVLQQLLLTLEGIIHGLCFNRMLRIRNNRQPAVLRVLSFWLVYVVVLSMSWITGIRIPGPVNLVFALLFCQILMHFFYEEKLSVRLGAWVVLFLMQTIAELFISFLYLVVQGHQSANSMTEQLIGILSLGMMLDGLFEWAACRIWVRVRRQKNRQAGSLAAGGLAMSMPFLCLLFLSLGIVVLQGSFISSYLITAGVSLLTFVVFLGFLFFFQRHLQKQDELEQEQLEHLRDRQALFFQQLEEQERKAFFFRHDCTNIAGAISQLLEEGRLQEAEGLLHQICSRTLQEQTIISGLMGSSSEEDGMMPALEKVVQEAKKPLERGEEA